MVLQEINLIHKFSHSEKVCKRFRYLVLSETGIKVEIGLRLLCVSSFMVSAERLNVNGGRVSKVSLSYTIINLARLNSTEQGGTNWTLVYNDCKSNYMAYWSI